MGNMEYHVFNVLSRSMTPSLGPYNTPSTREVMVVLIRQMPAYVDSLLRSPVSICQRYCFLVHHVDVDRVLSFPLLRVRGNVKVSASTKTYPSYR